MHRTRLVLAGTIFFLLFLSACASNQHLVFFTNSSIGVDISSEPETATPFKFVVGYKRQEGVIDPIGTGYEFHANTNSSLPIVPKDMNAPVLPTKAGYFVQKGTADTPHSVLAKMNFGATGGGAGSSAAQWFATGKAAEILAHQPGIAGAISGDPKVNESAKILGMKTADKKAGYAALSKIYGDLTNVSAGNDPTSKEAKKILSRVNALAEEGLFNVPINIYNLKTGDVLSVTRYDPAQDQTATGFNKVIGYISKMNNSLNKAKEAAEKKDVKNTAGKPLQDDERKMLIENIIKYEKDREKLENIISTNPEVIEMVEFYFNNILLTEK